MSQVRLRRLAADYHNLKEYARLHPRIKLLQTDGDPPEKYQIEYLVKSIRMVDGTIKRIKEHIVEISLPRNYPRVPPQCRMLSPVFHPNIAPHAICVGDHWSAGESLQSIVMRIGEMLAYQSHNVKSPLNGEAAKWVQENMEHLPLDAVSFLVDEDIPPPPQFVAPLTPEAAAVPEPTPRTISAVSDTVTKFDFEETQQTYSIKREEEDVSVCSSCGAKYRVPQDKKGMKVRCKKCRTVFLA